MPKASKDFRCPHCGKGIPYEAIASHFGKLSAKKLASKRDSDFFRWMQSQRQRRAGGRPPKDKPKKK